MRIYIGQIGGEIPPSVAIVIGGRTGMDYSWVEFFLGWWPLLFSQEWWAHIWYGVLGSPVVSN
jgi:hypothetical protein